MSNNMDLLKATLAGKDNEEKPKKEVKEVRVRKGHGGKGHIIEHHHTRPEHHPMEEHVTGTDDEMMEHMMQNMANGDSAAPDNEAAEGEGAPAPAAQ